MSSAPTAHPNQPLHVLQEKSLEIAAAPVLSADRLPIASGSAIHGAYIHVPFCFHKCHYCDFYSFVESRGREPAFLRRLIQELGAFRERFNVEVDTIFIGGGTPTLLSVELWRELLASLHCFLPLRDGGEFTVEANPETVTSELAAMLAAGGVNRISIGAQSFDPVHLKTLERWHDPRNVGRSVELMRSAGIRNLNLDLIFGIPGQTIGEWEADLESALSLEPDHMSCYSLMYEPNTPLTQKLKAGAIQRVDEDLEASMYERTMDTLATHGFEHYEISNWARPGARCRHNLTYWENRNWWAFGPSASGHVDGVRWKSVPRLADYLDSTPWPRVVDVEQLDEDGRIGEELMLRLRLLDGISCCELEALLACGKRSGVRSTSVERHMKSGLLERADGRVRLTRRGLLLADSVLASVL